MTELLDKLFSSKALKAWVAAVSAGAAAFTQAVADGVINGTEVGVVIGAVLVALGLVYRVPNAKSE